jgi:molybdate transport system permease protein
LNGRALPPLAALPAMLLVALLLVPLLALVLGTPLDALARGLTDASVLAALRLSLVTTATSLVCVLAGGLPLGWWLAHTGHRARPWIEGLFRLPMVLPPAVAGVALLATFGRRGLVGALDLPASWSLPFTTTAVILAQTFVAAPFFVQAASRAFRDLDSEVLDAARVHGASSARVFLGLALPACAPALIAGALMAWARALGEFGATLLFAGNLEGRTQTLPLAIYAAFETDGDSARAASILLVAVGLAVMLGVELANPQRRQPSR